MPCQCAQFDDLTELLIVVQVGRRCPGERVKNDRRDCGRLAELSRAGELKPIWVPDEGPMRRCVVARGRSQNLRLGRRGPMATRSSSPRLKDLDRQLTFSDRASTYALGCLWQAAIVINP